MPLLGCGVRGGTPFALSLVVGLVGRGFDKLSPNGFVS
jgi:hypothetical protein